MVLLCDDMIEVRGCISDCTSLVLKGPKGLCFPEIIQNIFCPKGTRGKPGIKGSQGAVGGPVSIIDELFTSVLVNTDC